ncbi:hypothetical protein PSTG_13632 [Puccinia striiformis f. sp. tritici PST-78]|uniref:Uncharacterized protein n=1 Tax=Puccinia striiformis f. sp. tritici PST-78 TaxID=1165861 RepID=A0A0L0V1D8_9BASI|nr:hypothetical protein PSTG_13632 [Puccinia striiformis f. sp. tritici PST-78]
MARASSKFTKSSVTSVTSNQPKSPNTQSPKSPSPQLTSETKINSSHQDESTKDAWLSEDEDVKVACMPVRQKNPKEWVIPEINGDHAMFIDHGTKLDKEGYPLYPNGKTSFVRLPGQHFANFGKVGYYRHRAVNFRGEGMPVPVDQGSNGEEVEDEDEQDPDQDEQDPDEDEQDKKKLKKKKKKKRDWTWKITRYSCLGVLTCNNEGCQWAGTPPTCRLKLEQLPKTNTCYIVHQYPYSSLTFASRAPPTGRSTHHLRPGPRTGTTTLRNHFKFDERTVGRRPQEL